MCTIASFCGTERKHGATCSFLCVQVQAAMEGAASAANSRSTSHAGSCAHSPDLQKAESSHAYSSGAALRGRTHEHEALSIEPRSNHSSPELGPRPVQHGPSADHTASAAHSSVPHDQCLHDSSPQEQGLSLPRVQLAGMRRASADSSSASHPGSGHSSPAQIRQQQSMPPGTRAAPADALNAHADSAAARSPSMQESGHQSHVSSSVPAAQTGETDGLSAQQHLSRSQASGAQSPGPGKGSLQQSPALSVEQSSRCDTGVSHADILRESNDSVGSMPVHIRHSISGPLLPEAQHMQSQLPATLRHFSGTQSHDLAEANDSSQTLERQKPASMQSQIAQASSSRSSSHQSGEAPSEEPGTAKAEASQLTDTDGLSACSVRTSMDGSQQNSSSRHDQHSTFNSVDSHAASTLDATGPSAGDWGDTAAGLQTQMSPDAHAAEEGDKAAAQTLASQQHSDLLAAEASIETPITPDSGLSVVQGAAQAELSVNVMGGLLPAVDCAVPPESAASQSGSSNGLAASRRQASSAGKQSASVISSQQASTGVPSNQSAADTGSLLRPLLDAQGSLSTQVGKHATLTTGM